MDATSQTEVGSQKPEVGPPPSDLRPPASDLCPPTSALYATAAIPEPYRILGLRLRPFSLGHYLLMQRFGCTFLASDHDALTRPDLILGVLICSMRHGEFLVFLEQKNFTKEMVKWGKRVGLFDLPEKSKLFQEYLKASLTEPEYIELHPSDGGAGDWAQNLKISLMTRLFYSEADALDMPLSKALADYYKLAESEGALRLITPEDIAAAKANTAIFDALERSQKSEVGSLPSDLCPPTSGEKGATWPA